MRVSIARAFAVALVLIGAAVARAQTTGAAAEAWIEVAPHGEAFTVSMPARPSAQPRQEQTGALAVQGHLYTATGADSNTYAVWSFRNQRYAGGTTNDPSDYLDSCAVLAWDLIVKPEEERARRGGTREPREFYYMSYMRDEGAGSLVKVGSGLDGRVGFGAREYDIVLKDRTGRAHILTDGPQIYIVAAFGPPQGAAQVETFLNSFSVRLPGAGGVLKVPQRARGTGAGVARPVGAAGGPGRGGGLGGGPSVKSTGGPCGKDDGRVFTRERSRAKPC